MPRSTASSARCRASSATSRVRPRRTSNRRARRRPVRPPARADVPRARQARRPDDHPRAADGGRGLRGRVVRDGRAPGRDRVARRAVHGDGTVVGRHDRRAAHGRRGQRRRRAGQTVYVRGGPGALASALAAAATAAGVEIRTGADVAHITSRDGRATGVVLGGGEELTARAVVAGIDPKRALTAPRGPGRGRPQPALARGQHPDARHGRQGQSRPVRLCPGSRRPATTHVSCADGS